MCDGRHRSGSCRQAFPRRWSSEVERWRRVGDEHRTVRASSGDLHRTRAVWQRHAVGCGPVEADAHALPAGGQSEDVIGGTVQGGDVNLLESLYGLRLPPHHACKHTADLSAGCRRSTAAGCVVVAVTGRIYRRAEHQNAPTRATQRAHNERRISKGRGAQGGGEHLGLRHCWGGRLAPHATPTMQTADVVYGHGAISPARQMHQKLAGQAASVTRRWLGVICHVPTAEGSISTTSPEHAARTTLSPAVREQRAWDRARARVRVRSGQGQGRGQGQG